MSRLRAFTVVAALFLGATGAHAQTPSANTPGATSDADGWRTVIYPVHLWLPILGAEARLPAQPDGGGGVTVPSAKTSGNLNWAVAAGFRLERGRVAAQGQFLWAGLSASVATPNFTLNANTLYGQLMGGFEVAPALYIEAGVRHLGLKVDATILKFPEVTWRPDIWEPVAGVTFRPQFSKNTRLMAHADVGIGDENHRTAGLTALVEWKPISHFSLGGGWGVLYLRTDNTIRNEPVHLQETLNGPIITVGIPF